MGKSKEEQFIVDKNGDKKAVVLDINLYRKLLEDIEDLRIIAERKDESTFSLEEVERRLKANGLL